MSARYFKSEKFLDVAESRIPLGSQTFSKSKTQYPVGVSPLFAKYAKGAYIWDIDKNKYLDLVSALAAVTLGYQNRRIDSAVKRQLKKGVTLSLPTKLEYEVAELIGLMVPSAEMVRFAKNGSDATAGAVRLARAYTNKKIVAMCGYHGWQDWSIVTTSRNAGVPTEVGELTKTFKYNDIDSLMKLFNEFPNQIACVIMEPMNSEFPQGNFLQKIRELCDREEALLIFDETITGFRYNKGGAQELFGVKPDLCTFGKGIANGYPLSVVAGKREIMRGMESIFFSGTFGGELLSLTAAREVLLMHQLDLVAPKLINIGERINDGLNQIIVELDLGTILRTSGHPSWTFLNWSADNENSVDELKTFFLQEMFKEGVLVLNTHNVTTSMGPQQIAFLLEKYETVLRRLKTALNSGGVRKSLEVEPLVPLFRVR
jgi:glutamate-1-semialdehyde 2,1-aminomutase